MSDDEGELLRDQLAAAANEGLADFDRARFRFVETLLARAAEGPPEARERLRARATERLGALREDYARRRAEAEAELARLEEVGADEAGLARSAFERHAFGEVRRAARRHPERRPRLVRTLGEQHGARLRARLSERAPATHEAPLLEVAQALYRERSADTFAQSTLADARRSLPAEAGPYHASTVAARALGALEQADRALLRAWIQRLRDLTIS